MSWQTVQLAEVADIERKGVDPSTIESGTNYLGLEHIESGGKIIGYQNVQHGELASTKFQFGLDHVLYGKLRPYLAKIALPDFNGICSTDILPIKPGPKLDRRFLAYFLRQPRMVGYASSRSTGANLPRLSPKALGAFEIPLPSLEDQKRIAAILDQADKLRRLRQTAITKLNTLGQSIFYEMFGDPVNNSMGWPDDIRLGDEGVSEIVSGITKGRKLNSSPTREVPYLAVVNVQDRHLKLDPLKRIDATDQEIKKYLLKKNDLLLTEGGDPDKLGRGTLWNNELPECIHQNHVFRVRLLGDSIRPVFLNWIIGSNRGKAYFLRSAKQTTGIASVNKTQIKGFPLLVPPVELQRAFEDRIQQFQRKVSLLEKSLFDFNRLIDSLQHRAFRGEL